MMQHIFVGTSILFPLIITDLSLNYTEFGIVIAVSSLIGGLLQILFSVASRKVARHVLLGLGNTLLSLGTFLTGLARNLTHFLGARTVANVGVAPQHPMGTTIIAERFDGKSIGKAMGIHYGVAYVGNIVGPLFMTYLAVAAGWRNALFVFSVPALIVGLTVIWYLGEGKKPIRPGEVRGAPSLKSDVITLTKTGSVIQIIAVQALISGGIGLEIITTYTPLFLADALKLDVYARGIIYAIGLIGGVMGPVLLGRHADRLGHLKTATLSAGIALILVYLLPLHSSASLVLVLHLFALGFVSFALPTLLQSHLVKITREHKRDLVAGMFFTVSYGFNSLWTVVTGYMIDAYSSFTPAFTMMGTLGLMAFVILVGQMRKFGS